MSDDQEFSELAQGSHSQAEAKPHRGRNPFRDYEGDEEKEASPGQLVQYGQNGPGLVPVTATVKTLQAGVWRLAWINDVLTFVPHPLTSDTLLRLPDSKSDEVVSEVQRFWQLGEKFKELGYVQKRGWLLWGPPGSGKSSTIMIVCDMLVKSGGIVVLSDGMAPSLVGQMLAKVRTIEPERKIIVILEDLDAIIQQHGEADALSLLDGETSVAGVAYVATTNYPENLDGRVVNRPSRFDRVVKIGMPNDAARRLYISSRSLDPAPDMDAWIAATDGFSIAHIKELIVSCYCYGNEFSAEVKRLKSMATLPKSSGDTRKAGFGVD